MFTYELHPLCTLFPRMAGAEFDALVADIKANGLREPIIIHAGMILDGGNRYRACIEAGIEPQTMQYAENNIVAYVLSANLHRRHMSAGQQAAIVASAQDWAMAQVQGANRHTIQAGNVAGLATVKDRAAESGASERTQRMADKVAKSSPELAKQVAHGEISLPKAVEQVSGKAEKAEKPAKPKLEVVVPDELSELRAENAALREANAEQGQTIKEMLEEIASLSAVTDSSDQLATALSEAKKFREMNRILENRVRGLQNECNAAKKAAKAWQRKAGPAT